MDGLTVCVRRGGAERAFRSETEPTQSRKIAKKWDESPASPARFVRQVLLEEQKAFDTKNDFFSLRAKADLLKLKAFPARFLAIAQT